MVLICLRAKNKVFSVFCISGATPETLILNTRLNFYIIAQFQMVFIYQKTSMTFLIFQFHGKPFKNRLA